jgi:hypothetical protein
MCKRMKGLGIKKGNDEDEDQVDVGEDMGRIWEEQR